MMHDENAASATVLAQARTDLAEDRTLLASERTFSGWARTAMASIGLGIGFNALFNPVHPTWVAKAIATLFITLGIFVIIAAERRADTMHRRLMPHKMKSVSAFSFKAIAILVSAGGLGLICAIWLLQ
jgi:putative membrane protein